MAVKHRFALVSTAPLLPTSQTHTQPSNKPGSGKRDAGNAMLNTQGKTIFSVCKRQKKGEPTVVALYACHEVTTVS